MSSLPRDDKRTRKAGRIRWGEQGVKSVLTFLRHASISLALDRLVDPGRLF